MIATSYSKLYIAHLIAKAKTSQSSRAVFNDDRHKNALVNVFHTQSHFIVSALAQNEFANAVRDLSTMQTNRGARKGSNHTAKSRVTG